MRVAPLAPERTQRSALDWLWALFWLAASSAWCITAGAELGATFDEPVYVARGLEGWRTGSHSGLLRLGTMPLPADLQTLPLHLYETRYGVELDPVADLARVLPWARAVTLGFWWLLLSYGWLTGRALAGPWGGRVAIALLACEPSLLAHASLATTDVALAACVLALVYHFRAGREVRWPRRVAVPMLWFAAAVLSKASAVAIAPLCLLAAEAEWRRSVAPRRQETAAPPALRGAAVAGPQPAPRAMSDLTWIISGGMLLVFVYCGSDWRPEPSFVAWADELPAQANVREPMQWLAQHLRIFSNAGEALVRQVRHNIRGHGAFLLGQVAPRALWYYFPVLLTIKLSEPLLLALPLVAVLHRRALANWPVMLAAALTLYSVTFRVQLGVRMVLPIIVFGAVGAAAALAETARVARSGWRRTAAAVFAAAAVLWNAANGLAAWPDGLVYVNRFWGGSADGFRLVSDSNYDWGQGVKALRRWQQERGIDTLALWYFGTDPLAQQPPLHVVPLHALPITSPEQVLAAVRGGYLAVSTTLLYGTAIDSEAYRQSLAVLRARQPVARTTTFLIYDFTAG